MRPAYLLGGLAAAIAGCSAHAAADRRAADEPGEVRLRVDRETVQALRTPDRQVYVHGSARLSVVPDVADISIGVTSSRPTAPEALAANNRAMAGLVEAIKARAIAGQDIRRHRSRSRPRVLPAPRGGAGGQPLGHGLLRVEAAEVRARRPGFSPASTGRSPGPKQSGPTVGRGRQQGQRRQQGPSGSRAGSRSRRRSRKPGRGPGG